ncbi:hypothetical protein KQI84_05435 [bacterium]|nr:hypothetical protein [bacterium]
MRKALLILPLFILLAVATPVAAFLVTPLDDGNLAVEVDTTGQTLEDAVAAAKLEAVKGTVGRVYLSNNLTLADDLLGKYLENYGNGFVSAVEVLNESYQAGQSQITARVFIDYARMIDDLTEKKFLYTPAYKPRFVTFMTERLDGEISKEGVARETLAQSLNALGMRRYGSELPSPPAETDVIIDELLLDAAIISAQRAGVEIIVSGEVDTTLREQRRLYYDDYWFYDTEMTARMVRVDTGEVLFEATAQGSASDTSQVNAVRTAIQRASDRVAEKLLAQYEEFWPVVVQRGADYEVLLTGITDETLEIVKQNVERLGHTTNVHLRKRFDRSAVLAIEFDGPKADLLDNLESCPFPTLYILNPDAERDFEVQVSG